jgi:hypothetical protein
MTGIKFNQNVYMSFIFACLRVTDMLEMFP